MPCMSGGDAVSYASADAQDSLKLAKDLRVQLNQLEAAFCALCRYAEEATPNSLPAEMRAWWDAHKNRPGCSHFSNSGGRL